MRRGLCGDKHKSGAQSGPGWAPRKRKALLSTETELKLIAKAAILGDSNQAVKG
jgi:hypothetical protein